MKSDFTILSLLFGQLLQYCRHRDANNRSSDIRTRVSQRRHRAHYIEHVELLGFRAHRSNRRCGNSHS
jgi:hypothetical protein